MALSNDKAADAKPAAEVSAEQTAASDWPKPGDEGYVVPDGTEQSRRQLAQNRQAAADRMAAGSTVHGAPAATPGPQLADQQAAAVKRAEDYSGKTEADRRKGVTESIRTASAEVAEAVDAKREGDVKSAVDAQTRTADEPAKGRATR